jgi:hypothetical protein
MIGWKNEENAGRESVIADSLGDLLGGGRPS